MSNVAYQQLQPLEEKKREVSSWQWPWYIHHPLQYFSNYSRSFGRWCYANTQYRKGFKADVQEALDLLLKEIIYSQLSEAEQNLLKGRQDAQKQQDYKAAVATFTGNPRNNFPQPLRDYLRRNDEREAKKNLRDNQIETYIEKVKQFQQTLRDAADTPAHIKTIIASSDISTLVIQTLEGVNKIGRVTLRPNKTNIQRACIKKLNALRKQKVEGRSHEDEIAYIDRIIAYIDRTPPTVPILPMPITESSKLLTELADIALATLESIKQTYRQRQKAFPILPTTTEPIFNSKIAKLREENEQLKKLVGTGGFIYTTWQEPIYRIWYKPDGTFNYLSLLWSPIKVVDSSLEILNGALDSLATAGKFHSPELYLLHEVDFGIKPTWRSRLAQTSALILRLPVSIFQNAWNFVAHPWDSFIQPLRYIYAKATAGGSDNAPNRMSKTEAAILITLHMVKSGLMGFAIISGFGAFGSITLANAATAVASSLLGMPITLGGAIAVNTLATSLTTEIISSVTDLSMEKYVDYERNTLRMHIASTLADRMPLPSQQVYLKTITLQPSKRRVTPSGQSGVPSYSTFPSAEALSNLEAATAISTSAMSCSIARTSAAASIQEADYHLVLSLRDMEAFAAEAEATLKKLKTNENSKKVFMFNINNFTVANIQKIIDAKVPAATQNIFAHSLYHLEHTEINRINISKFLAMHMFYDLINDYNIAVFGKDIEGHVVDALTKEKFANILPLNRNLEHAVMSLARSLEQAFMKQQTEKRAVLTGAQMV